MKPTTVASVLLALVLAFAAPLRASDSSALISAEMDKLVKFELANAPLPEVLKKIEEQTGVPLRAGDDVYDLLPWGRETTVNAKIENLTLRDAMQAITAKLGLRFELQAEVVQLRPIAALQRIGRRATVQELRTIDLVYSAIDLPDDITKGANRTTVDGVVQEVDSRLAAYDGTQTARKATPANLVLEFRPGEPAQAQREVRIPRDTRLVGEVLDQLAAQTPLAWYPWGDTIVVLPKKAIVRNMLERTIHVRYDGIDVASVLTDLSDKSGVPFLIEPGALQRVPADYRSVKLFVDAPARQALESLAGVTGLGYVATDDGVYIWNNSPQPAGEATQQGRVVATVDMGNGMQALITEDMLTPEQRATIEKRAREAIEKLETK
jgi:hypothetical protein